MNTRTSWGASVRLSAEDRKTLERWVDRAVADLGRRSPGHRIPAFDWSPLLREALGAYALREPLQFLAAVIRAIPSGQAVDLGPLSDGLCEALLAHLRAAADPDAQAAVAAAERLIRGHNRSPGAGPGAL
jgi:hypothetical protein